MGTLSQGKVQSVAGHNKKCVREFMQPINGSLKRKHFEILSPGAVSSIGDVLVQSRLKHSYPDAPIRWNYKGTELPYMGNNTADGQNISFNGKGGPATLLDSNWEIKRQKKINHGWVFEDLMAPDVMVTPYDKATPDYSWNNKIAAVNHSFDSGGKFLPLPGGYSGQGLPRGGAVPMVTNVVIPQAYVTDQQAAFHGVIQGSGENYLGIDIHNNVVEDPYRLYANRRREPAAGTRSYATPMDENAISRLR